MYIYRSTDCSLYLKLRPMRPLGRRGSLSPPYSYRDIFHSAAWMIVTVHQTAVVPSLLHFTSSLRTSGLNVLTAARLTGERASGGSEEKASESLRHM